MVLSSDQKKEMSSECGRFPCERKYVQGPWYEYLKESLQLRIDTIYKNSVKEILWKYVGWVHPAQGRHKLFAVMKTSMKIEIP
jgi:hypothetical protein